MPQFSLFFLIDTFGTVALQLRIEIRIKRLTLATLLVVFLSLAILLVLQVLRVVKLSLLLLHVLHVRGVSYRLEHVAHAFAGGAVVSRGTKLFLLVFEPTLRLLHLFLHFCHLNVTLQLLSLESVLTLAGR